MIDGAVYAVTTVVLVISALFTLFYAMVSPLGIAFDGNDPEFVRRQILVAILLVLVYLAALWALQRRKPWAHWLAGVPFAGWAIFFAADILAKGWNKPNSILIALNVSQCVLLAWRRDRILPRTAP